MVISLIDKVASISLEYLFEFCNLHQSFVRVCGCKDTQMFINNNIHLNIVIKKRDNLRRLSSLLIFSFQFSLPQVRNLLFQNPDFLFSVSFLLPFHIHHRLGSVVHEFFVRELAHHRLEELLCIVEVGL